MTTQNATPDTSRFATTETDLASRGELLGLGPQLGESRLYLGDQFAHGACIENQRCPSGSEQVRQASCRAKRQGRLIPAQGVGRIPPRPPPNLQRPELRQPVLDVVERGRMDVALTIPPRYLL